MLDELVYVIPDSAKNPAGLKALLKDHPEICFVSLVGVDLRGNDTDEKIPVSSFVADIEQVLGGGIQTDGSSVVMPGIATLNDAKVDLVADYSTRWVVDYNWDHIHPVAGKPVGTLRIPSFLLHSGEYVDSRSVLVKAVRRLQDELKALLRSRPDCARAFGFRADEIEEISPTAATELEFWVKTPGDKADVEQLSTSQVLQEQYWKRTKGAVRTALEQSLMMLEKYQLGPEMGHKEVGGVKAEIDARGEFTHIMEQLEIDWSYSNPLQAADNVIVARNIIKETFRHHGLDVTFMAKPIEGVAGNGMHTHVGIAARMKGGGVRNMFWPLDPMTDYLSPIGWGAIMGILKNYEAVGALITCTNDAYNRLKPGFEAPVAVVASIGHSVAMPSRNRTVLVGLVRDLGNPLATRFEVRSPYPRTNAYLALAAIYQAMLDGIKFAVKSGKTSSELEAEFSKSPDDPCEYLEPGRLYRTEQHVSEHFTPEERAKYMGSPPATVWEGLENLARYPEKTAVLTAGDVFTPKILASFREAAVNQWVTELRERIIHDNVEIVRSCRRVHDTSPDAGESDEARWARVHEMRLALMKDTPGRKSLFSRLRDAIERRDYAAASAMQLEMNEKMAQLKAAYHEYLKNLL
ncbi:MAG: glutamine synthetase [Firmicutes bacterium]|nr:glutamine synthetase [Bacillota bacterium]